MTIRKSHLVSALKEDLPIFLGGLVFTVVAGGLCIATTLLFNNKRLMDDAWSAVGVFLLCLATSGVFFFAIAFTCSTFMDFLKAIDQDFPLLLGMLSLTTLGVILSLAVCGGGEWLLIKSYSATRPLIGTLTMVVAGLLLALLAGGMAPKALISYGRNLLRDFRRPQVEEPASLKQA